MKTWITILLLWVSSSLVAAPSTRPQTAEAEITEKTTVHSYLTQAGSYLKQARETGRPEFPRQAETLLREALKTFPEDYSIHLSLAQSLLSQHRFEEALELGQKLTKMRPASPAGHAVVGDAAVELGRYTLADLKFQTLLSLRPGLAAYSRMAYILELKGKPDEALQAMKLAVDAAAGNDPQTLAWCLFQVGLLHFKQGDLTEAERYFQYSLEVFPQYYLPWEHLGELRAIQGKYQEAAEIYREVISRNPEPEYYLILSQIEQQMGDTLEATQTAAEAEARYQEAIRQGQSEYYGEMAEFYLSQDTKLDVALDFALKHIKRTPTVFAYDTLAWAHYYNGNLEQAENAIQEALALGTLDASIHYHAGQIALAQGETQRAHSLLQKALRINPYLDLVAAPEIEQILARSVPDPALHQ